MVTRLVPRRETSSRVSPSFSSPKTATPRIAKPIVGMVKNSLTSTSTGPAEPRGAGDGSFATTPGASLNASDSSLFPNKSFSHFMRRAYQKAQAGSCRTDLLYPEDLPFALSNNGP